MPAVTGSRYVSKRNLDDPMPQTAQQQYEQAERELIQEAIGETEQEIADSAWDKEPDDNDGDTSLEQMDPEEGFDDDDVEGESEDEDEGSEFEEDDPTDGGKVIEEEPQQDRRGIPPSRLREEAEARRVAQAEARELRARIEAIERAQRQPVQPQPQPAKQEPPDLFADPEGRLNWERQQIAAQFAEQRLNSSFGDAHEQHGDKFVQAFQSLQNAGSPALVREITGSNNPGRALMQWHDRQSLMNDIGNDPAAYRQKLREELLNDPEVRKQLVGGMREQAVRSGNMQTKLPPSLNSASGGTSHRSGMGRSRDSAATTRSIEQEIFQYAFDDN